jgi:hypothetical protein
MSKPRKQLAPEDEVLRRMLHTPPKPHKAPAKKAPAQKKASKS